MSEIEELRALVEALSIALDVVHKTISGAPNRYLYERCELLLSQRGNSVWSDEQLERIRKFFRTQFPDEARQSPDGFPQRVGV